MKTPQTDFYKTFGITREASEAEIKSAYRRLALMWHPDQNNNSKESEERFKEISEAYEILRNPEKRKVYDQRGFVDSDSTAEYERIIEELIREQYRSIERFGKGEARTGKAGSRVRYYYGTTLDYFKEAYDPRTRIFDQKKIIQHATLFEFFKLFQGFPSLIINLTGKHAAAERAILKADKQKSNPLVITGLLDNERFGILKDNLLNKYYYESTIVPVDSIYLVKKLPLHRIIIPCVPRYYTQRATLDDLLDCPIK